MVGIIIGIAVIGIGVLLLINRRKTQNKLLEIKSTQTVTARDLNDLWKSVSDELGTRGGFRQAAEVKGVVRSDQPLTSELGKHPCVHYEMRVEERYEETYTEKDAQGTVQRKTRTGNVTVASNTQNIPFFVEDATGRVLVRPDGANIDPVQMISKYEPHANQTRLTFGGFTFNVAHTKGDRRILGYQFTEKIVPLDRPVYVLGEASDASGELAIQKPSESGRPFIITLKSEEELTRSTESSIKMLFVGAIVCFAVGLAIVGYAAMQWGR
jgi:hypothetical protein